jgi:hypothetical protein
MAKPGDGSEFRDRLAETPPEKQLFLTCSMSGGAILPKDNLPFQDDPNIVGSGLPIVLIEGQLSRLDGEDESDTVVIGISFKDAVVLRRTIDRLEQAIDESKAHEHN